MRHRRVAVALFAAVLAAGCGGPAATVAGSSAADLTVVVGAPGSFRYTLGSEHCGFGFTLELQRAGSSFVTMEKGSGRISLDEGTWVVQAVQFRDEIHRECDLTLTLDPA